VVAVNKWDGLDSYARDQIKGCAGKASCNFIDFARFSLRLGAARDRGWKGVFRSVDAAYKAAIGRSADAATDANADRRGGQAGAAARRAVPAEAALRAPGRAQSAAVIVIHGNALDKVPESYQALSGAHVFREVFKLAGDAFAHPVQCLQQPLCRQKGA
jgi:GTP-binding protein